MKSAFGTTAVLAALLALAGTAHSSVVTYDINATYSSALPSSIIGSFTMDSSGPASISNVDIQATLPLAGSRFSFTFDGVINPVATWSVGYLKFTNASFYAGDTYFMMFVNYDTVANDGSYLIGSGFHFHQSEISIFPGGDWLGITGEMTPVAPAVPEPPTWAMMILGFLGIGAMTTYRLRKSAMVAA